MSSSPADAALRRRLRLGTVGLGVAVAALSGAVVTDLDVLTGTSRRAVEATAAAYGTTPAVAFVTLHAPLVFGVLAGAVGSVYVGLLLPDGITTPGETTADPDSVAAAVRFYAASGAVATALALGPSLAVVVGSGPLPAGLFLAFVAGVPVGVLALCGATVGTALRAKTGVRSAALLGTAGPAVGVVLAHAAPTGPVWTVPAGTVFVAAALVGGGWTLVREPRS